MSDSNVNPDTIEHFLLNVLCRKSFHVYSIDPKSKVKNGPVPGCAGPHLDEIITFIERKQQAGHGIYYAFNTPKPGQLKKAKESEIVCLEGLHIDIDPPKEPGANFDLAHWQAITVERLTHDAIIDSPPTAIIRSGSGVQAIWLFKKPMVGNHANRREIAHLNRRLARHFGADNCHNVDRVLRMPGTVNYPDAKKVKAGRVAVMATLAFHEPSSEFTLRDFERLPPAPRDDTAGYSTARTDYTRKPYSPSYEPIDIATIERERPDIIDRVEEKYDEAGRDRSAACYSFLANCAKHIIDHFGCAASDALKDTDIKRNLAELMWDSESDLMLSHYEEQKNPRGSVGYDIDRMLKNLSDDGVAASEGRAEKAKRSAQSALDAREEPEDLAPDDARRQFIEYVQNAAQPSEMPNGIGDTKGPGVRQLATESNVRAILREARIILRWNMMKDETHYRIDKEAGGALKRGKPVQWFARAVSGFHRLDKPRAERELILDCLANYGITQRGELPAILDMIARERPFHPMEDYCTDIPWDGVRRIGELAKRIDTAHPLRERYMEVFFRQGVAVVKSLRRYLALGEGEVISSIVILNGPQDIGKTEFWNALIPVGMKSEGSELKLGANKETDSMAEVLSGAIANLDEIESSLMRSEHSKLKNFMSTRLDRYRVAFAKIPVVKPRMTQMCGTANDLRLFDHTGSRRFLVMNVEAIDRAGIEPEYIQQCFAEAWHDVFEGGANWWLTDEENEIRARCNAVFNAQTEDELAILSYMNHVTEQYEDVYLTGTQIARVCGFKFNPHMMTRLKTILEERGCSYREQATWKGRRFRRVFSFPMLPEDYLLLSKGAR